MDFKKTFLLVLCCVGVVSSVYAADDEQVSAPIGWMSYFRRGAAQLHANASNFAQRYAEHQDGERVQALGDAQTVAESASQVIRFVVNAGAQSVSQAARSTVGRASQARTSAVQSVNRGAESVSQAARSAAGRASEATNAVVQRASQAGTSAVQGVSAGSRWMQESEIVGPAVVAFAGTALGCPEVASIGLVAGCARGLSFGLTRPVTNACDRVCTAVEVGQHRVNDSINGVQHVVRALGREGDKLIAQLGEQGRGMVGSINAAGANQQKNIVKTASALGKGVNQQIRETNRELFRDNTSHVKATLLQGLASATSIGIGAAIVYKNLKKYKGRKSAALVAVGGLMMVAPFVTPTILEWLKSKQTANAGGTSGRNGQSGKRGVEAEKEEAVDEDDGRGLPHDEETLLH